MFILFFFVSASGVASTAHGDLGIDQSPSASIALLHRPPSSPFELPEVQQRSPPPPCGRRLGLVLHSTYRTQGPLPSSTSQGPRYNTTLWTTKLFSLLGPCRPGSPSYSAVLHIPGDPSLKVPSPQSNLFTLAHRQWRAMSIYNYLPPSCFSIWAAREQMRPSMVFFAMAKL